MKNPHIPNLHESVYGGPRYDYEYLISFTECSVNCGLANLHWFQWSLLGIYAAIYQAPMNRFKPNLGYGGFFITLYRYSVFKTLKCKKSFFVILSLWYSIEQHFLSHTSYWNIIMVNLPKGVSEIQFKWSRLLKTKFHKPRYGAIYDLTILMFTCQVIENHKPYMRVEETVACNGYNWMLGAGITKKHT